MLRPASTWPRVNRLLLMEPVSLSAASPSFPVACIPLTIVNTCLLHTQVLPRMIQTWSTVLPENQGTPSESD